jgi:hypothetical protein
VLFNGNLLIGKAYTAQPGRRQIRLHPLDAPPEGEEGTSSDPGAQPNPDPAAAGAPPG